MWSEFGIVFFLSFEFTVDLAAPASLLACAEATRLERCNGSLDALLGVDDFDKEFVRLFLLDEVKFFSSVHSCSIAQCSRLEKGRMKVKTLFQLKLPYGESFCQGLP